MGVIITNPEKTGIPVELLKQKELPLPGKIRLARNAAKALVRNTVQAVSGKPVFLSPEAILERQKICQSGCEFFRPSDQRCAHPDCGCNLGRKMIAKWRLVREVCPLKKW